MPATRSTRSNNSRNPPPRRPPPPLEHCRFESRRGRQPFGRVLRGDSNITTKSGLIVVFVRPIARKKLLGLAGRHTVVTDRRAAEGGTDAGCTSGDLLLL